MKQIPFTQEGYDDMKNDRLRLQEKRKETVISLSRAREMGDLSENGLYKAAKMELGSIDRQLRRIDNLLRYAHIVGHQTTGVIDICSNVVVFDGTKQRKFSMVGDFEADPSNGKISQRSPIGRAMLGRQMGEEIEIETPGGKIKYRILSIS